MRLLVITRSSWSNDNNTGNTMTNLFEGFKDIDICNIYFRNQMPDNKIACRTFHITEQQLISSIIKKGKAGKEVVIEDVENRYNNSLESSIYGNSSIKSLNILLMIREIIWNMGNWKNHKLDDFLSDNKPDIIFMPVFGCYYPHKVLEYIKKKTSCKVVLFHADDNYTLKQFSISPLYWLYRLGLRKWVRKSVDNSDINYCISNIQKEEYEKCFKKECRILYKGSDFNLKPKTKNRDKGPIKFVFTGNISSGRWKTLSEIGKALSKINKDEIKAQLVIYTKTPISKKMKKALEVDNSILLMGGVPNSQIANIQQDADILVHVESFNLKERLQVRQSFSTKIVDYLASARCIFAVGSKNVASIDYLIKNDAAIVATNEDEILLKINQILENHQLINQYADKAWRCGEQNHKIEDIQQSLYKDLRNLCEDVSF